MSDDNVIPLAQPGQFDDALTQVLRDGAARLLAAAVEAEVEGCCQTNSNLSQISHPALCLMTRRVDSTRHLRRSETASCWIS